MTVTAEQIEKATKAGLINVAALAAACDKYDLRFYLGCVILEKESRGRNIYGHDRGGVFTTADGSNVAVTEENYREFRRLIDAGRTSNGVGPMQITYKGHFPIMDSLGLKPWDPADNIDYGVSLIAADYRKRRRLGDSVSSAFKYAATVYNLGSYRSTWPYGIDAVNRAAKWKKIVGTDDLGDGAPAAPPPPVAAPNVDGQGRAIRSSTYGDRVWWGEVNGRGGGWVSVEDAAILDAVQGAVIDSWGPIRLSQGGLSSAEPKSARTHVGLAVWDVAVDGRSQSLVWELSKAFLRAGHVAFPRGYGDGMTPRHIHVVSRECVDQAHSEGQAQLHSKSYGYLHKIAGRRGAGLAGAKWRRYIGPSIGLERWADSPYNEANIIREAATYYVKVSPGSSLIGNTIDRTVRVTRERGTAITSVLILKRWGRLNAVTADGTHYALDYLSADPLENS